MKQLRHLANQNWLETVNDDKYPTVIMRLYFAPPETSGKLRTSVQHYAFWERLDNQH